MSFLTMNDLAAPLGLLRLLAADFAGLPAVNVDVSTIFPNTLELVSHDDFGAFEAWRSALGIEADSVSYAEQSGGQTRVLQAETDHTGVRLRLTAYSHSHSHQDNAGEVAA
ncbi:hypothetical protein ABZ851_01465 [Streptomyces sp. NPDC047049]|uniref:hypothetical protein n=1 Tax=Streptomyces sp. NPDC047049 TaxID=3156688 RepID=UPI0033F23C4E